MRPVLRTGDRLHDGVNRPLFFGQETQQTLVFGQVQGGGRNLLAPSHGDQLVEQHDAGAQFVGQGQQFVQQVYVVLHRGHVNLEQDAGPAQRAHPLYGPLVRPGGAAHEVVDLFVGGIQADGGPDHPDPPQIAGHLVIHERGVGGDDVGKSHPSGVLH